MKLFNWFFKQKVKPIEVSNGFLAADSAIKQSLQDCFFYGFITQPTISERNTTPNMSVDINPPLKAYDENGEWVYMAPGSPLNFSLSSVVLPTAGNQRYATLQVAFQRLESDSRVDGNGSGLNYVLDHGFAFSYVLGAEAVIGSAVKPSAESGKMALANILLSEDTTEITNSLISTDCQRLFSLSDNARGVSGKSIEINRGNTQNEPENSDAYSIKVNRGAKPPFFLRVVEGSDASTDAPVLQYSEFTDSENSSWVDIASKVDAGGWLDKGAYLIPKSILKRLKFGSDTSPDLSAYFQADFIDKGFAGVPEMNTTQRDAIASPLRRLMIYNLDTNKYQYWNGAFWAEVGGSADAGERVHTEFITVTSQMITDGYYDTAFLPTAPSQLRLSVVRGANYRNGTHYDVIADDSSFVRRVTIDSLPDLVLQEGDELEIVYSVSASGGGGGGGGGGILGGKLLLVAPDSPSAADDANTSTPFVTFQQAHNQASSGDTILIGKDELYENATITKYVQIVGLLAQKSRITILNIGSSVGNFYARNIWSDFNLDPNGGAFGIELVDCKVDLTVEDQNTGLIRLTGCEITNLDTTVGSVDVPLYIKNCFGQQRIRLNNSTVDIQNYTFLGSTSGLPGIQLGTGVIDFKLIGSMLSCDVGVGAAKMIGWTINNTFQKNFDCSGTTIQGSSTAFKAIEYEGTGVINTTFAGFNTNGTIVKGAGVTVNPVTVNQMLYDGKPIVTLPLSALNIANGSITDAEFQSLDGMTGLPVQEQLNYRLKTTTLNNRMESGADQYVSGSSKSVAFSTPFNTAPIVVACRHQYPSSSTVEGWIVIESVTTTGFTYYGAFPSGGGGSSKAGTVKINWIATGN